MTAAPAMHRGGHDTEYDSARSVRDSAKFQRAIVLRLLREAGAHGLTDDEGGLLMGRDRLVFGRRRCELYHDGQVVKTQLRRPTPFGRSAIVWRAADV